MFSRVVSRYVVALLIAILPSFGSRLAAQTATLTGSVSISKKTMIRQISATAVEEQGSLVTILASFTGGEAFFNVDLRVGDTSLNLFREGGSFKFQRSYSDRASMELAVPAGPCTLVTPLGNLTFILPAGGTGDAKLTNFDALQSWDGTDTITATIGPTNAATSEFGTDASRVQFGMSAGLSGEALMVAPTTTIVATIFPLRLPNTVPGQTFTGLITFGTSRLSSGAAPQSTLAVRYDCTINFPVARAYLPPQITTQPAGQTVSAGTTVTLSVTATGSALSYSWLKNSQSIPGATNSTLVLPNAQPADSGTYSAAVSNTGGRVVSSPAEVTVNSVIVPPSRPTIVTSPASVSLIVGASHTLSATATGTPPLSYQWFHDGIAIGGATSSSLSFAALRLSDAGSYTVVVTNPAGSATSPAANVTVTPVSRISNLSIRTRVGGGDALTIGLTVGGSGTSSKPLLIRAVGPTLAAFGVDSALADPQIALLSGASVIAQNDDWSGSAAIRDAAKAVGAFALASDASKDAALAPVTDIGSYTVRITGAGAATGIALAEIYDATPNDSFLSSTPRLTNVSALTQVGTGTDILIAGFAIAGSSPKQVLIRGIGPALRAFGLADALVDPKLEIFASGSAAPLAVNDNWSEAANSADVARATISVGAFELATSSKDAVLLLNLSPGNYTAQISGVANTTGSALVEVYDVP